MGKLFLLSSLDTEGSEPIAIYATEASAEKEARRLETLYKQTNPAFRDWCRRRWAIVGKWGDEERLSKLSLPDEAGEQEIIRLLGECPPLEGSEDCVVNSVDDRTQN